LISFQTEHHIEPSEFRNVLIRSTLGDRRPVNDPERIKKMAENASLIITARDGKKLVGIARSVTDFTYCTYLSDLAVDQDYQKQGIGKDLIRLTKLAVPEASLILLSAPAARHYYPKIGMDKHEACYILRDVNNLT
tara:strand:+ start:170844 stop:171251 length:408 start_codon:yes stop_codon:yes gene_type:complete